MKQLEGILNLVGAEFDAIIQNGKFRSREEIRSVYELMDIVKDSYCIWKYEMELEEGEGEEGMSSRGGSYYREGRGGSNRGGGGSYYEDGGSYYERRGRGRNASRDSRGRYNEGSYRDGSYRDGGMMRRGGSYYREGSKEEFAMELKELMQDAPDEQSRQSIQQMLQQMGQG